MCVNELYTLDM